MGVGGEVTVARNQRMRRAVVMLPGCSRHGKSGEEDSVWQGVKMGQGPTGSLGPQARAEGMSLVLDAHTTLIQELGGDIV
jgi:hypothetical protein